VLTAATEAASAEGGAVDVLVLLAALLVCSIAARALARLWVSTAMFLVLLGVVLGPSGFGLFDVAITTSVVHLVASLALATVLFSDAAATDVRRMRTVASLPLRLLSIGLLGSVALGALLAASLLPAITWALALVVAAILAPTDAALGAPVVTDPTVPEDVREVLTVESGLNDGLVVPILLVGLAWADLEDIGEAGFAELIGRVVGIGLLCGAGVAVLVAVALIRVSRRWGTTHTWSALTPLLAAVACYVLAEHLGGSGFIAAFVGGLAYGALCRGRIDEDLLVDESVSNLLQGTTWFVFGAAAVGPLLLDAAIDPRWVVYAVLSLTVVRFVPVWLALLGTRSPWPTVAFIAWFGPRGLASVVFLVIVLDLAPAADAARTIVGTVTLTVLLSVVLHGVSAHPAARAYGAWYRRQPNPDR
jgi:NhaP-type Na+/H+ or K+/H+ antiporter